ncbi:helix-turn-helix domain-containing protein [Vagococcus fluvialis]|uniref:helix-turn-helix domain-containing protein n=1 Tax=Vagococcus fluvialis TaxID=2738 RepID=UPI001D09C15A|nr:helix-turn-helix transcriptional regulator [Vagococcus fluvialis]UDM79570.1 helix-turn-helix transcriptional regulator [Vagococcus fluvialis]
MIKENLSEVFAKNFRILLAESKTSKTFISDKTGISRTTLTNISSGNSKMIQFESIEKIAEALNIEPYELFKTKKSS